LHPFPLGVSEEGNGSEGKEDLNLKNPRWGFRACFRLKKFVFLG